MMSILDELGAIRQPGEIEIAHDKIMERAASNRVPVQQVLEEIRAAVVPGVAIVVVPKQ